MPDRTPSTSSTCRLTSLPAFSDEEPGSAALARQPAARARVGQVHHQRQADERENWARERADVLDAEPQFGEGREENHEAHADKLSVKK
jgi:hypothetical protein